MDEWAAARSNIERFDGYLNDLRKYGFGLVTSLLAVTGYLSSSPAAALSDPAKVAVGAAILVLVVALAFLDGQYRALQKGATIRARILEKSLNLGLTGTMAQYARLGRFSISYFLVYEATATAVFAVGLGILWGSWFSGLVWLAVFGVAVLLVYLFGTAPQVGTVDWSVDAKVVRQGQTLRVTFTTLQDVKGGPWLWASGKIEGVGSDYSYPLPQRKMRARFLHDISWIWPTDADHVPPGLYKVVGLWYPPPDDPATEETSHLPARSRFAEARAEEDDRYSPPTPPGSSEPPPNYVQHVYTITVQVVARAET